MKKISFGILLVSIFLGSCKKYLKEGDLDKQITLDFALSSYGTQARDFETAPPYSHIIDFDKRDYPKVDSITFHANLFTNTSDDTAFVRLFNVTDNVEIANSEIYSSATTVSQPEVRTNNIFKSLPDKKITLAIQLRRSSAPTPKTAATTHVYLKLRRP